MKIILEPEDGETRQTPGGEQPLARAVYEHVYEFVLVGHQVNALGATPALRHLLTCGSHQSTPDLIGQLHAAILVLEREYHRGCDIPNE